MTTHRTLARGALFAALVLAAAACDCGPITTRRNPSIEERVTNLDFGAVQLDLEHRLKLIIYNGGNDSLTISTLTTDAPFSVVEATPLSVAIGTETELTIGFHPTVKDKREVGSLRITSDDPERPEVKISLSGTGVQAVARGIPSPIAFGDVWVGENKTVTVKIKNDGSNELVVVDAQLLDTTPDAISGDLAPLRQNIPAGGTTETQLRFAPTQMSETIPGGVRIELLPVQGGELVVPFSGRGVRSVPRLCFQLEGTGFDTCTDANAQGGTGTTLSISLPPICDAVVSPPDAGFDACQGAPYALAGKFYVVNEGNVPVSYSMQYKSAVDKSCDGGTPSLPDFQFSNAPSPSTIQWPVSTVELAPMDVAAEVQTVYRATANCISEASDQAQIVWTRQGMGAEGLRQPNVLFATITGQSKLPHAVPHPIALSTAIVPSTPLAFNGADNQGIAEFAITGVDLFELVAPTEAGSCSSPDAGIYQFQNCNLSGGSASSWCARFDWAPNGNPNDRPLADRIIPVGDGGIGSREIGAIVYGPRQDAPPSNQVPVCIFAVSHTTDPFHPVVISKLQGNHVP